jgi:alpha-glucosidase
MPWNSEDKNAGFSVSDDPYLPVPEAHYNSAVDVQGSDPESMLNFTRRLLELRKTQPALSQGSTVVLETAAPILAYLRKAQGQTMLCVFNLGPNRVQFRPDAYLDDETLKTIKMPRGRAVSLDAYGSVFQGIQLSPSVPKLTIVPGGPQP